MPRSGAEVIRCLADVSKFEHEHGRDPDYEDVRGQLIASIDARGRRQSSACCVGEP